MYSWTPFICPWVLWWHIILRLTVSQRQPLKCRLCWATSPIDLSVHIESVSMLHQVTDISVYQTSVWKPSNYFLNTFFNHQLSLNWLMSDQHIRIFINKDIYMIRLCYTWLEIVHMLFQIFMGIQISLRFWRKSIWQADFGWEILFFAFFFRYYFFKTLSWIMFNVYYHKPNHRNNS